MPIIENMPADEYFAADAASNSGLKLIRRSPAHYLHGKKGSTPNLERGSARHMLILEPEKFKTHYYIAECDNRTRAEFKGLAKDVGADRVLPRGELESMLLAREGAMRNSRFRKMVESPGRTELSVFTTDPVTGLALKCRFDWKGDGFSALDLKSTTDARPEAFEKVITSMEYDSAVAFYAFVWEIETGEKIDCSRHFPLAALENDAPNCLVMHDLDEIALMRGRKLFREALNTMAECINTGVWGGYKEESVTSSITAWEQNKLMEEIDGGFSE